MSKSIHNLNKERLQQLRRALYNFEPRMVQRELQKCFATDAKVQLAYPFENLEGAEGLFVQAYEPLHQAIPDLERRDYIVMAGSAGDGTDWVGCGGYYTGSFEQSWLDIPATGHQVAMRYHEFFRMEQGQVVEVQALWDIPEVMMQAGAWPMVPSLGREWHVPGPASQDGLVTSPWDAGQADASLKLVGDMLASLGNYKDGGVEAMQLEKYWHPRSSWYGPSGIGTGRGIQGFRNWHQIPFLNAMPNRVGSVAKGKGYLFGDGDYVGFTAWPGMQMTISDGGWLGIAPANQEVTMRSLDFWRCENGMIRENWVLVDLLDVYRQIGVDVFARMREFNKARR
ncbi:ester cyclase [Pseudomaricurvus alkylphenolicus]|uniref:ester cyclase n=1 Tax=Pseudomaricurvus alkylphenolicus TaxID=1306991 RepID=UPI00142490FC|nr:ester cyclase [Pseudomaricurvus alkylphenolicus]NIB40352.1 ester cyclase [Pseudomaricurvus alkylphenolicus]